VNQEQDKINEFRKDAFNELGIQNDPRRELAFSIAWQYTKGGFHETMDFLEDLAKLLKF